jgi:diphthamide synthase (EF-2-diphthine--ammonia ligase)
LILIFNFKEFQMHVASWSGGKDSAFACYRAIQKGYTISHFVNFISDEYKRK